jgi:hypothetical protein
MEQVAPLLLVPNLLHKGEGPLQVSFRFDAATEADVDAAQVRGGIGLDPSVPGFPGEREGALEVLLRLGEVAKRAGLCLPGLGSESAAAAGSDPLAGGSAS